MYRTAKSLELVKVEVYGCSYSSSYLFLHKTLILCNVISRFIHVFPLLYKHSIWLFFVH